MAEIQFERRGRPLWLVLLVLAVVAGVAYFSWTSCASLQRQGSLQPTAAPVRVPAARPGAVSGSGAAATPAAPR